MNPTSASKKKQARTDAEAWALAEKNSRLVYAVMDASFAWIFNSEKSQIMSREDYFQEGMIGMFTAAKKYDPKRGEFSTYAWPWIFQAISRAHRAKHYKGARVAYGVYEAISKIKKAHPEDYEKKINTTARKNVLDGFNVLTKVYSLDNRSITPDHPEAAHGENPLMRECVHADNGMLGHDMDYLKETIRLVALKLTELERYVIFAKFGIDRTILFTREIAKNLKITKRRVDLLERSGMKKIRKSFKANKQIKDLINP